MLRKSHLQFALTKHRFIASLTTAKIYTIPPSIEKLVELFQDFYLQAESHIFTHIQILSSRQYRDASPAPSISSRTSARLNPKASKDSLKKQDSVDTGRQMLTPDEISERRKARRLLDHKRVALEEAVERRACEAIYDRLWRHKSTLDGVQDEKLRSKAEALNVVGIGLKDLGIELGPAEMDRAIQREVEDAIVKAKQGLVDMNLSRSPLGKLQGLAATHQTIVDLLTKLHQSSSSADEILPTMIYTLIRSPAEEVNAISNLNFIQRFRSSGKINGEAAYCLTNLEAAITFLETVDLASLRSDEAFDRPKPNEGVETTTDSAKKLSAAGATTASPVTTPAVATMSHVPATRSPTAELKESRPTPPASPGSHQRRLSSLFQPHATAFGAASDAVISSADQGFRNISTTLDSSFKLLFGRLKEQATSGVVVPKTLDEARRMVSPKAMIDEDGTISEGSSFAEQEEPKEDRLLSMITGGGTRDRSLDSTGGGSRRLAPVDRPPLGTSPPVAAAAVESMRNLGNTLNPLNRLSSMNVMRFGRMNSTTPPVSSPSIVVDQQVAKIGAPVQRFVEMADAKDLKIGDVDTLLKDYQRLVQVLKMKGLL
jgi:hypothetical protein